MPAGRVPDAAGCAQLASKPSPICDGQHLAHSVRSFNWLGQRDGVAMLAIPAV